MSDLSRRQRSQRGMFVTGVMTFLWLVYVWALSRASDAAALQDGLSSRLAWGWVAALLGTLVILVTLVVFDRWIKRADR